LDTGAAREKVRVARALGALPKSDEAFAAGRLSYSKVRAITRIATPANEERVLERICSGFRRATEPEIEAGQDRYVRGRALGNGLVKLEIVLSPDEADLVLKAIEHAREGLASAKGAAPGPSAPKPSSADAIVHIAAARLSVVADPSGGAFVGLAGGKVEHYDGQSTWTEWGSVGTTRGLRGMLTFAPFSADRSMVFRVDQPSVDGTGDLTSTPLMAGGLPDLFAHGMAWGPSAVADEAGNAVLVSSFWPAGPPGISGQRYIAGQGWTAPVRVVQTPTLGSWAIATRTTDGSTTVIVLPDSNVAVSRLQSVRFVPNHP
jgi:hypothetical protein